MIANKINLALLLTDGSWKQIGEMPDAGISKITMPADFSTEVEEDIDPPSVKNTFSFECTIDSCPDLKDLIGDCKPLQDAQKLADRLNDLIEEYHAPGAPRRERRAIKREFDRIFRIYVKHCEKHNIKYTFQKQ